MRKRKPQSFDPIAYPAQSVPVLTGIGLWKFYADARSGLVEIKKNGRCSIVLRSELERYLAALPKGVNSAASPNPKARKQAATAESV